MDNKKLIRWSINSIYASGCIILYLFSSFVIVYSLYEIVSELLDKNFEIYKLLDDIGLIIFSLAVIDIAKYLLQEEVLKREKTDRKEFSQTLTKIISIVSTALFLKGLIMTMEISKTDISKVYYPLFVIITPVFLLTGLGVYHYFVSIADKN